MVLCPKHLTEFHPRVHKLLNIQKYTWDTRYINKPRLSSLISWAQAKPSHANDPAAVVLHQGQFYCTPRGHLAMSGDTVVVTTRTMQLASSG